MTEFTDPRASVDPGVTDAVPAEPRDAKAVPAVNGKPATLAEVARRIAEQTTAAQGLPLYVEDPATLRRVAQRIRSGKR